MNCDRILVTNPNKLNDGFGENYKLLIYSVMYAEFHNHTFVYTPFKTMEHNYDNDPDYLAKKEKLINFMSAYSTTVNRPPSSYTVLDTFQLLHFYQTNLEWCSKSESLKKIKILFRMNKQSMSLQFTPLTRNIAIHIRRMNEYDSKRTTIKNKILDGMDVPVDLYTSIIEQMNNINIADNINAVFHIYSQGILSEFEKVFTNMKHKESGKPPIPIKLHINEPLEDTFIQLVFADVLIIAPSALSYCAGLLSEANEIFYIEFCNPPLPSWLVIQGYKSTRIKHEFVISNPTPTVVFYDPYTDTFEKC